MYFIQTYINEQTEAYCSVIYSMSSLFLFICSIFLIIHTAQSNKDQVDVLRIIDDRLKEHVTQDNLRCNKAPWAREYTKFHKDMLESKQPKILVAVPNFSGSFCFVLLYFLNTAHCSIKCCKF
jgi:hypothetical protein